MAKVPQGEQKPTPRKTLLLLTDDEWRAVRIAAVARDTSIQSYLTTIVLAQLQGEDRSALDAAAIANGRPTGQPKARRPSARPRA